MEPVSFQREGNTIRMTKNASMKKYTVEVCVDSVASAIAARKGGADRLELCSGLVIGGLSPSPALFRKVQEETGLPIRTLLRPRFGDFCYNSYEFAVLQDEIAMFRELGAQGVVIGALQPDGTLPMDRLEKMVEAASPMNLTFHRAFDLCRNPFEALEQCTRLGIGTILTSGQKSSAWEGRFLLQQLQQYGAGRVEILVGAGVTPDNIGQLARFTGAHAFHLSGKKTVDSVMDFRRQGVPMGMPGMSEFEIWETDWKTIRNCVKTLEDIC